MSAIFPRNWKLPYSNDLSHTFSAHSHFSSLIPCSLQGLVWHHLHASQYLPNTAIFTFFHSIWFNTLIVIGWELTFRRHHVQCFMYTVSLIYISTKYICIWVIKHFPFKIQNPLKELSLYHPVKLSCSCKSSFARGGGGEIENRKPILDHNLWLSVGQEAALGRTPQRRTQDELRSEHLEWAILNERGVQKKAGKCLKELVFHFS